MDDFTEREKALVAMLTMHFANRSLDARLVDVETLGGGESETLRLTLDDTVSTDLERDRIADPSQSLESLAEEARIELEQPGRTV